MRQPSDPREGLPFQSPIPRRGRAAKLGSVIALAIMSASAAPAESLGELFRLAASVNQDYSMAKVDLDLAGLRRTKAEIEAKVELDRISAQIAYEAALGRYLAAITTYYNEVVDTMFVAAIAELDVEIAALTQENAAEDRKYAERRYRTGLVSEEDFKKADMALRTAEAARDTAALTSQDAKDAVLQGLGFEWRAELLPDVPASVPQGSREEWVQLDPSLRSAILASRAAQLKTAALPGNAPSFDRRIQETENLKAKAALDAAQTDAGRAYEGIRHLLKSQEAALKIRSEDSEIKAAAYQDALRRYQSGSISITDRNAQRITELNSRKSLVLARQTYVKSIGKFLVYVGRDPTEP